MEIGQNIHGFVLKKITEVSEMGALLYEMEHEVSGAEALYIKRDDSNKTFAISFKTLPDDDTGVFHILEHSLLGGSRKFPVKEPFVYLLKNSLKTYLNAMTFSDKTVYPVSSRSERDFLNLVDVYMDAVFHPLAVEDPKIFMQEGWHHELHRGESTGIYRGVVFNEMKGAYSSVDDVEYEYLTKLLYRGTPYACDSGGDPKKIPTLTFEKFVDTHKKYYRPENAKIILDGDINLSAVLPMLDGYLSEYRREGVFFEIPEVVPCGHIAREEYYEIAEGEDPSGKERINLGYLTFPYYEREKLLALSCVIAAIAGSNDSPLKRALLESGLLEDASFVPIDGIRDCSLMLNIKNVKKENRERVLALVDETFKRIINEGIDRERLAASLSRQEFRLREADGGAEPMGISMVVSVMEFWLYGAEPYLGLEFESLLSAVKAKLTSPDYFENLLSEVVLNSRHSVTLVMLPSTTLGAEREAAERAELCEFFSSRSESELDEIISKTEALEAWQRSDDKAEDIAKIPTLTLADIPQNPAFLPTRNYKIGENTVVYTDVKTHGISYFWCAFDVSDLSGEELFNLSLIADIIGNIPAGEMTPAEIQTKEKANLGSFSLSLFVSGSCGEPRSYIRLGLSLLDEKKPFAPDFIRDLLLRSDFSDSDRIEKFIRQTKLAMKEGIARSGHIVALSRAASYFNSEAAANQYIDGIEAYRLLDKLDSEYHDAPEKFESIAEELVKRVFVRDRIILSYAGAPDDAFAEEIASLFPTVGKLPVAKPVPPIDTASEGIVIPAQISYSAMAGECAALGERMHGSLAVVRNILSYGYLWNEIRVGGGAYGAGFVQRPNGTVGFYSYRDPDAAHSISVYSTVAEHLRSLAEDGADLTDYIIGTIGDYDPIITPKLLASLAFTSYLRGETNESRKKTRDELISTSHDDLRRAADIIERATKKDCVCVIGASSIIDSLGDKIKTKLEL